MKGKEQHSTGFYYTEKGEIPNFFFFPAAFRLTYKVQHKEQIAILFLDSTLLANRKGGTIPFFEAFEQRIDQLTLAHCCEHLIDILSR